jgi:RHS repeat-associated protein
LLLVAVILGGLIPVIAVKPLHALATSAYETDVLGDSPSIYYRLGDSSGTTATDSSGNSYNGTYGGSTTLGVSGAITSDGDTAVSQGSTGTPVTYTGGSGISTGNASRSAEVWYKTSTSGGQPFEWGKAGTQTAFGLILTSNTNVELEDWTYGLNFRSPRPLVDGNWHYLVVTYDGSTATVYLDGASLGSQSFGHTMATTSDTLTVGSDVTGSESINGSVDEFAAYSSVLTPAEVATHWRNGNALTCPSTPTDVYGSTIAADSPSNYYRFDEGGGRGVVDYSGHCRTGAYTTQDVTNGAAGALRRTSDTAVTLSGSGAGSTGAQAMGPTDGLPTGNSSRTGEIWYTASTTATQLFEWGTIGSDTSFGVILHSNTQVEVEDWTNAVYLTSSTPLLDSNWHYVAATYNGTTATVYVDGLSIGSTTFGHTMATTADRLTVGGDVAGDEALAGNLDDFAAYSSALSASQVTAHYRASGQQHPLTGTAVTAAELYGNGTNATHTCSSSGVPHGTGADPVDTESGNFSETFTDLSIAGRSCPLAITRTYNAATAATNSPFGYGWTYNYALSLSCSSTTATITQENGSQVTFTTAGNCSSGSWTPTAPRFLATLVHNGGGTWTFTRQGRDTYTFNSSGQLTAIADLNGYTTTLSYTSTKLTSVTDPAGRTLTLGWTGSNITSLTDANVSPNRTVSYTYNVGGELTDVTDVEGGVTHFAYDGSHRITTIKDPVCQALGGGCPGIQNHYDGNGRVDWQKDQLNRETDFAYAGTPGGAAGGTTTITDPEANVVVNGYQYGVRTFETRGYGTGDAATTYSQYDPDTLALTAVIDPNGGTTTMTVDGNGNVLTLTDPLGRVTTSTYNAFDEVLTTQDGNGKTTTKTYDGNGNLATVSRPVTGTSCTCQVTTYHHANGSYPGDVTSVDDADGKTTSFHYDSNGYPDQTKDPLGNLNGTVHNAVGWVTETYTPKAGCTWNLSTPTGCSNTYKTAYSYLIPGGGGATNEFGDVQTVTDPLSHVTTYGWDADRHKTSVQDGNGNTTSYTFDKAGQLTTTTRPDATTQVTDYNDDGTVLDLKDGAGNALQTFAYNARGEVASVTDALSNATTYTRDGNGNVLTKQDPGGNCGSNSGCTTMTYDADNELATVTYSDGVTPNITSVTYDNVGHRTGMSDGTGSPTWSFDNLNRLTSYTSGNGDTVSYAYTNGGNTELLNRPLIITYPNSVGTVTQTWNDDGTLASVKDWNNKTTTFGYDANANETSQVSPSTTNVTDTLGFNAADQMTSVSDSNGSTLFSATYTRDSNGQLSSDSSQASNQANYKYTSLSQLCYAGSGTGNACGSPPANSYPYGFSSADNLTTLEDAAHGGSNTQQFDTGDEMCWAVAGASGNACNSAPGGAMTFNYDARGNRTSQVPNGSPATCDGFDQANRLTSVKTGTGSSCTTPSTVGTYAYDGDGVRQSKAVSGTTTHFTWDESGGLPLLLQEKAGAGNPVSYIYGPSGLPVEQIAGSTTTYLHHDQIGSTRLVTDSAGNTGTATTTAYDPYGNVVSTSGALTSNLGFSGEYLDAESGLYYLRARYYDPATAQFLTRDPAVATTMSPYGYAAGNPLSHSDPSGMIGRDRLSQDQQKQVDQQCSTWGRANLCSAAAFCENAETCRFDGDQMVAYYGEVSNAIAACKDGMVTLEGGYKESIADAQRDLKEIVAALGAAQQGVDFYNADASCKAYQDSLIVVAVGTAGAAGVAIGGGIAAGGALDIAEGIHLGGMAAAGGGVGGYGLGLLISKACS